MITRRKLLVAGAGIAGAPLIARYAHAAEFTFKYASNRPASHPTEIEAARAIERIANETNGRVNILMFPNNVLGSDADMLNQTRAGAIQFFNASGLLISPLVPVTAMPGLGFIFNDYDAVWQAMDGKLGQIVKTAIGDAGLHVQEKIWDSGFRHITSSVKPVNVASDLKGFKIRVPVAPIWVSLFEALGASPTGIAAPEIYSSLQTHLVDGQENSFPVIEAFKVYEVQKYCSLTNHMWDGFWILTRKSDWDRLPADIREVIARNWDLGAENERVANLESTKSLRTTLESQGLVFNNTVRESFVEQLRASGFYAGWKKKFGDEAWAALEKYTGALT
jgi:tripartite ATP-independent transporter DctP family solute receptor